MKEYDLLKIFDSMRTNDISEVIIKDAGRTYEIRRGTTKQALAAQTYAALPAAAAPTIIAASAAPAADTPAAPSAAPAAAPTAETSSDKYFPVKSPLVGTFYASAKPDAPAIVEVGSKVTKGMTLCIVEAMKNFNEIQSEVDGIVREVCVKNGDIIDFGKVLFRIETN
ncbi:MAG: acetyl-CoA carboxylase biotin carboxyl carrier protein [Spirochaetales bacterium]|nr:acetyl-CoA carboxylase biotin carboxyl carrier protein [Spirochaetales bacterium]MBR6200641.1 acetyl-CoA carboxylase biotin carboxyl carrier protein [Spirochaetales bacterium]